MIVERLVQRSHDNNEDSPSSNNLIQKTLINSFGVKYDVVEFEVVIVF